MTKKPKRLVKVKRSKAPSRVRDTTRGDGDGSSDSFAVQRRPARPFLVVGVGGSAGGMDAFIGILRSLPADVGAAFVFVCHLDPKHESTLDAIFQRETKLPVMTVKQPVAIEAGHVYVLQQNKQLRLSGGVLRPEARRNQNGEHRPIDMFFSSLAQDQGNSAVAVILSGNGRDGVAGLEEIKAEGGITFAQTENTASFPALPQNAFASGCVDFVLAPDAMAKEIQRIARHPAFLRPKKMEMDGEPQSDIQRVFALLRALNGVDFSYYKHSTLKRRIVRRMVLRKMDDLRNYITYLQQNPMEVDLLFHDLLINVTSFFRDPPVFAALRRKVFPKIVRQRPKEPVRIWVPGCSTGEEVYSLGIALTEFLGRNSHGLSMQLFATDISETALAKARAGIYPETITTHVSPERLRRFFTRLEDGRYQISKFIRDSCVFARQNLIEDPPFSKLDLISCRNVLIYLGPVLQKKVIPTFHYALKPGGQLLLGGSETIGTFADLFRLVDKKHKIFTKLDTASRPGVDFLPKPFLPEPVEAAPPRSARPTDTQGGSLDFSRHVDRLLLAQFAPSGVVINTKMEALQFRGQTGAYLEHSPGDASLNLLRLVRHDLLVDVRTVVSRAIKSDAPVRKDGIEYTFLGKKRLLTVEAIPFKIGSSSEQFFLILFSETAQEIETNKSRPGKRSGVEPEARREVLRLREELASTKESLQAIIEEHEATNEELKSANEEIQSSNEELQSTNEELETAKEELQSTNEELTTLNEELHTRNVELSQLNNDLGNLLSSVSMPILMLGNDLTIRRFTPLAERFFNLIPSDVGRRISDINTNVQIRHLDKLVTEVIDSLKTQEHDVQDRDGRWFSLRIRPYRTTDNKIDGAVILLVDVDETKQVLTEFMQLVDLPLLTLRGDLRVLQANEAFHSTFQTTSSEVDHKLIYELQEGAWNNPTLKNVLEAVLPERHRIEGAEVELSLPGGPKVLTVNARRLFQRSKGTQITLMSCTPVGESGPEIAE